MGEYVKKQSSLISGGVKSIDRTKDLEDAIDIVIREAKERGYETFLDYVKDTFQSWSKEVQVAIIEGLYDEFLDAVQNTKSKEPWADGVWNTDSTFLEWLSYVPKEIEKQLDDMKWRIKTQYPSFAGLLDFLPDLKDAPSGLGTGLSKENYEFFELILRKTKELVESLLRDEQKFNSIMLEIENRAKQKFDYISEMVSKGGMIENASLDKKGDTNNTDKGQMEV